VATLPLRRDAEKAAAALREKINSEIRSPETVSDLIAHYLKHELTTERKAYSTVAVNSTFIRLYVAPTWGNVQLSMVKSVAVEEWLSVLPLSPASRTKIKAVFSALFSHAIRHEWVYQIGFALERDRVGTSTRLCTRDWSFEISSPPALQAGDVTADRYGLQKPARLIDS
jgi:hypothetical protein